jgi:hypothetical protein
MTVEDLREEIDIELLKGVSEGGLINYWHQKRTWGMGELGLR